MFIFSLLCLFPLTYVTSLLLLKAGYAAKISEILAAEIADKPGALYEIFQLCDDNDINIEYIYSFVMKSDVKPLIIMKVDKMDEATELFESKGIRVVGAEELYAK